MSIVLLIFGIGFLILGFRYNQRLYKEEGIGGTGIALWDLVAILLDKLPYRITKTIIFIFGIFCFTSSLYYFFNDFKYSL